MRPRATWITVGAALALVLAVMAWVTSVLLELDANRIQTEREAVVEEQARLALWRIDTAMTPILSREVAALDERFAVQPSDPPDGVLMRFELGADGLRPRTRPDPERVATLRTALERDDLFARLSPGLDAVDFGKGMVQNDTPYALKTQALRNEDEWNRRKATVSDNMVAYRSLNQADEGPSNELRSAGRDPQPTDADVIQPIWVGEQLLLVRRVGTGEGARIEGSWLDWPALQQRLAREVADLLPAARIVPVPDPAREPGERMLATLPARLDPGATIPSPPDWSPLRASVLAGWLIVLAAFAALVLLVRVSLGLSERRAAFVSAVTHELRTPLTTFRMYTEMLGEGMVEQKREHYVATLRREAERLSSLVENVLAFARIESDRAAIDLRDVALGELVDGVVERLRERCESTDMHLEVELGEAERGISVRADPAAVEQILFNLVDNATKYAASPDDRRVCIGAQVRPRRVALHVRDFGPGIPKAEVKLVFEPFTKARADAAGAKPGVGLGLALSRRLARQMHGDLTLAATERGADFVLSLDRTAGA